MEGVVVIQIMVEVVAADMAVEVEDVVAEEGEDALVDTGEVVVIKQDSIIHMLCQGRTIHLFQRREVICPKSGTL